MAFRKKFHRVIELQPDLLVVQECEHRDKLKAKLASVNYNQLLWFGNNPNKGVAVLSFNNIEIEFNQDHNKEFEYIIPIHLKINNKEINLFCIWAMPHKTERSKNYVGQIWGAINYYLGEDKIEDTILIGDFNSNAIWDKKRRVGNHTDVVNFLEQKGILSIYHQMHSINHGEEIHPTLFLLKNKEKPYHIDYCFASSSMITDQTTIKVGKHKDWIDVSDHMPIIISSLTV